MIGKIKDKIEKRIEPLAAILPRHPNLITITGLILAILSLIPAHYGEPILVLILVILAGLMDGLDGLVARRYDIASKFGAFLDSTLDRYVDFILIMDIVLLGFSSELLLIGFIAYLGSIMTSYIRARGESLGLKMIGRGLFERPERTIYIIVLLIILSIINNYYILLYGLSVFAILTNLTAIQRGAIVAQELNESKAEIRKN
ncbi:MAG: CDP-alcohol phosphatidyltransferase family protein [Thermocladium sp.]